jgi:hypothetical protein
VKGVAGLLSNVLAHKGLLLAYKQMLLPNKKGVVGL